MASPHITLVTLREKAMTAINTGLSANARKSAAAALRQVLADTYVLYLKTHAYHWNVTGPQFPALHALFETQYRDMWAALDALAERLRALDEPAPASGAAFTALAKIEEDAGGAKRAEEMVRTLVADHETLIRGARAALAAAGEAGDAASEDLLTQRIAEHEKTAWMLRATAAA
jgi:starvation-inducible DNA-binding protein